MFITPLKADLKRIAFRKEACVIFARLAHVGSLYHRLQLWIPIILQAGRHYCHSVQIP